jgi:hypothetical protein
MKRLHLIASLLALAGLLAACANVGVGIRLPIPGVGSIGIGGTSDGRVSGGVSVGTGGARVDVGASGRLPAPAPAASAASAPAGR